MRSPTAGSPTRNDFDRLVPAEGVVPIPRLLAIDCAGNDGFYGVEIFSDDGSFG